MLERIESKQDRYRIELAIAAIRMKERVQTLKESGPARLMPLAERFAETADMPALSQVQCLALLCREPCVTYRLKHQVERSAADIKLEDFRSRGRMLGGLDTRDAWHLEAAHLGNRFRDGGIDEVGIRLETVLADTSNYEAGAGFVVLCIQVLHEHALWLLADGRPDRVAAAIPLSQRLYATMMARLRHCAQPGQWVWS